MKKILFATAILALAGTAVQAQEFDDIYYNPKKDSSQPVESKKKKSNYIKDFSSIDVDTYNRRGQYYESPIDTIGVQAENGEDFVYTQKIQKFYNPTVVVDNADILADVIDNSYGNVNIIFENGLPYFNSIYGWPGYYDYYSWYPSWRWNSSYYWSYNPMWGFELWPSWSLGPSWAWGPSFGWGWGWNYGPSWGWGWGPGWGPSYGWGSWGRPFYADYAPGGRLPNRPGSNWANNTRPGGNIGRPVGNRPGYSGTHASASNRNTSVNHHRTYSFGNTAVPNRANGQATVNRQTYTVGTDGHRRYGTTSGGSNTSVGTGSHRNSTSTYNSNRSTSTYNRSSSTNSNRSSSSYNTGTSSRSSSSYSTGRSSSTNRSSGGSYGGGGRASGGSGRGRR